jgi:glycosyltransferase involved in cell wall biosynthesis
MPVHKPLPLSVIVCTYNRADYLKQVLESLRGQTLPQAEFEIILIDDGSSDHTRETVEPFRSCLPLKYFYQRNAGLASAKNHGIFAAQGRIVLFLDDDDVTTPSLLEEHLKSHRIYPRDNYAVLHYTTWGPGLTVTPLMHFITEVGCFLFSYPRIEHGAILDFTYFWGGRSSCKRAFLLEHGVFNPIFRFGCEDIELGYRLSTHDLRVVYNAHGMSKMIRAISFDDFCRRLVKQGRSQYVFSTLHNYPVVHQWAETKEAEENWDKVMPIYDAKIRSASELDRIAQLRVEYGLGLDGVTRRLLHRSYWWAFKACKMKGIAEARELQQKKNGTAPDKSRKEIAVLRT